MSAACAHRLCPQWHHVTWKGREERWLFAACFPFRFLQLCVRANYGSGGWGFKSLRARHVFQHLTRRWSSSRFSGLIRGLPCSFLAAGFRCTSSSSMAWLYMPRRGARIFLMDDCERPAVFFSATSSRTIFRVILEKSCQRSQGVKGLTASANKRLGLDPNTALNIFDGCSRPVSQRGYAHCGSLCGVGCPSCKCQLFNGPLSSFARRWKQ